MLISNLKNILFLICFIYIATYSQEKANLSAPETLALNFDSKLKKISNKKLLDFAHSVKENPGDVLSIVSDFYTQICQSPENRTVYAYAKSPLLNAKKCWAYVGLSRKVNGKIYLPHVYAALEKMHKPIDPEHNPVEMKEIHEEYLATLTDHPLLAQKAATLFEKEWACASVQLDLAAHQLEVAQLHDKFNEQKKKLFLSEQNDITLARFEVNLDKKFLLLRQAIYAILYQEKMSTLNKNVIAIIVQHIKTNSLEDLQTCLIGFPLPSMNALCKIQNKEGNGLLHHICLSSELSDQQKYMAINFLTEISNLYEGQELHINEHNNEGKTPLDLVDDTNTMLKKYLYCCGAEHALPKVTSLKKSYDTPPSTPNVAFEVKSKRIVTFQHDKTS